MEKNTHIRKRKCFFLFTSELKHRPAFPCLRHHFPASLHDKVAVDELPDAGDFESHLRMHNAEVLI